MRRLLLAFAALAACLSTRAAEWRDIPAGKFRPFLRGEKEAPQLDVPAFRLAATPVTNAEFLEFVRANPQWQRSQVKRLFADAEYLRPWSADLELGEGAQPEQPVTFVSWFAAKAYCAWKGARLPTTAEWEYAAGAGYQSPDGAKESEFVASIVRAYSTPAQAVLPHVASARPNFWGVHDLHGLVWEWTSDFNSALITGDARGDSGLDRQLFCGAGALGASDRANVAAFMRFGFRSSLKASYTIHNLGFRCASAASAPKPSCCTALAPAKLSTRSVYQLASTWTSDADRTVALGTLRGRPQVLAMFFASCQYACPIIVHDMKRIERALPPMVREGVGFTLVSFDSDRDTPKALRAYRAAQGLDDARWTLLRAEPDDVREFAALLGINFKREASGQFAHSNLITVLDAEGEVVHQLSGLNQDLGSTIKSIEQALASSSAAQLR